jgi:hypothetical protein
MSTPLTVRPNNENLVSLPLAIIDNFFTCHKLSESKQMLREIKEQLFQKSYPYSEDSVEHDNVRYFFEKMEELIDAAHLLNQK